MNRRTTLRGQLRRAWREVIETDYARQRINSERSLQAALWARLDALLPPGTRRMFIEPSLRPDPRRLTGTGALGRRNPDLVICNTCSVIGVVELKYLPRARPKWQKDLETFEWVHAHREHLSVANSRFRGIEADARRYPLAGDVLFVWAGIHAQWDDRMRNHLDGSMGLNFLELHAETASGGEPRIR